MKSSCLIHLLCGFWALLVGGEAYSEVTYYAFPQSVNYQRSGLEAGHNLLDDETSPSIVFFVTSDSDGLQFLGEVLVKKNTRSVERFQLGWAINSDSKIWFGRHHSQIGYWHVNFHHGTYLQTSISKPAIVAAEKPLPTHITGFLWEGGLSREQSRIEYKLSLGLGPELNSAGLKAVDIVNPNRGEHKPGINVRVSYQPDELNRNKYGAFFSSMVIPSVIVGLNEVTQSTIGLYADWTRDRNHIFGAAFYVLNELDNVGSDEEVSFSSAYVQAERQFLDRWTLYARVEEMNNAGTDNAYLKNFKNLGRGGMLGGAHYKLSANQVLKVEWAPDVEHSQGNFGVLSFEWSAVLQ